MPKGCRGRKGGRGVGDSGIFENKQEILYSLSSSLPHLKKIVHTLCNKKNLTLFSLYIMNMFEVLLTC
jgi:hypothetical protein